MALRSFEDYRAYLRGSEPQTTVSSGGSGGGGATSAVGPAPSPATFAGPEPVSGGSVPTLGQAESRISGFQSDLADARQSFQRAAGGDIEFGQQQQALLGGFLERGEGDREDVLGLRTRRYEGPLTLDDSVNEVRSSVEGLQGYLSDLSRDALPSYYRLLYGLTPGEARFEAREGKQDAGEFKGEATSLYQDAARLRREIAGAQGEARDLAALRQEQAADFRRAAEEFGRGFQTERLGELDARVEAANRRNREIEDAYGQFLLAPDRAGAEALGIGEEYGQAFAGQEAASAARAAFDERWGSLSDVPFATSAAAPDGVERRYVNLGGTDYLLRGLTKEGPLVYRTYGGRDVEAPQIGEGPAFSQAPDAGEDWLRNYARQIYDRQVEYERLFGMQPYRGAAGETRGGTGERGQFAEYSTDLFEGGLPVASDLATLREGTLAQRGSIATEEERQALDRASEFLGEENRLAQLPPHVQTQILTDVEGFLQKEEAELEKRRGRLTEAEEAHERSIHRARKRYEAARDRAILNLGLLFAAPITLGASLTGSALAGTGPLVRS